MRRLVLTTALPALAILALPMAAQAVEPGPTPTPPSPAPTAVQAPAAVAGACADGQLCIQDYETKTTRGLKDANARWADFGWGSRADWFYNNRASASACTYVHNCWGGTRHVIAPGKSDVWRNIVNSNKWC